MNEAEGEQIVAQVLTAKVNAIGRANDHDSKFKVLAECVRRHINKKRRDAAESKASSGLTSRHLANVS